MYFEKIVKITKLWKTEDVYDCTLESNFHGFDANGIVVHNCSEIFLESNEVCCLSEIFLPHISSYEELCKVAEYCYRTCKHSLAIPCHIEATEEVIKRNFRIGIGITGYMMATEEQKQWLSGCYNHIRAYDQKYSSKQGWPTSKRLNCVKPSGTLSLLGGVSPGCHPAYSKCYIRRVRFAADSPLLKHLKTHGYHIEYIQNFDGSLDYTTQVVEFPIKCPDGTIVAKDMTATKQLEIVKRLQTDWADNAVSVTVYYKKEELPEIKEWLNNNYNDNIKAVSFLLHSEHGFKQAPYEEITEERYNEIAAKVTPITNLDNSTNVSDDMNEECASGVCPIK